MYVYTYVSNLIKIHVHVHLLAPLTTDEHCKLCYKANYSFWCEFTNADSSMEETTTGKTLHIDKLWAAAAD